MLNQSDLKHRQVVLLTNQELRHLCISQGNIVIKDENDEVLTRLSKNKVLAIMSIGHITLTSILMDYCQKNNIALILMNERLRPILFMSHSADANFLLRQKQYLMTEDLKLYFASRIVQSKIDGHILLLKNIRQKNDEIKQAISTLEQYREQCLSNRNLNYLMGIEGNSAKLFFKIHFSNLKNLEWRGRKPRLKLDPVNVVLDMGYTLLFNYIECNLKLFGFDVYQGVLHQLWFKRKSLVCDFVEPFRCIIDKQVLTAFNLGKFKNEHFTQNKMQYYLNKEHNRNYNAILMQAIIEHKQEVFIYLREYYRLFMKLNHKNLDIEFPEFDLFSKEVK
ncbi:MAG: type V CRISPR-associated endonuclease Cas1 [Moraxella sp.]|uniref:type V CRISPR-associated endonuclease Cas1 n=1 Tax=Moraxella sp. TaxID=479 RepID=UPI0026DBB695|nr:type V CRISPR-associated endonuclease Cas1 [Moraxella sp.]MDO4450771.1 type V CRISPR-associated endonuclease Cas1 [Moraxella sp.]